MKLILGTFLFSVASALVPILNVEAYLAAVAIKAHNLSDWELAAVGAGGQTAGKVLWYLAGTQSLRIRWIRQKMETEKWQLSYERWHERIVGRPAFAGLISLTSAVTGFPPLAVIAVLAGTLRMNFAIFFSTVLVGRTIRFWLVLAGVSVLFGH
ncbi:MAG TPA: VTT domain-containing protein [Marmoricola sp.]|nr:VTT domain-containing protein [Marmoricola sp.]